MKDNGSQRYFYMLPGSVPQGPAALDEQQVRLAAAGSQEWKSIEAVETEWQQPGSDA